MAGFPTAGEEYAGRYLIVRELGHGGTGIVYEAVDNVLNRTVALKIVLPSLSGHGDDEARLAAEAAVLATIRSRHIVGIEEHGKHDDTVYYVTELFPDGDLQSWLADKGPLDRRSALLLVAQVCEALADAHSHGVVHRDLKPRNVLLWNRSEGLIPYLRDFGIAMDGQKKGLTRTGALAGSPAYMAPERHFGHSADERGDIYSVGCLLWAALTGSAPYSGTDFQMMNSHINEPTPQLGTGHPIDSRIDEVLTATLDKDPEQRIATADEVRQRLLAIMHDVDAAAAGLAAGAAVPASEVEPQEPVQSRDESSTTGPAHRRSEGHKLGWLVAAAVVALLVGGVAAAFGLTGQPPPSKIPPSQPEVSGAQAARPPPRPAPPRVSARSDYRAVTFVVASPRYDDEAEVVAEYNAGGGWLRARPTIEIETPMGGAEECVRFRSLAAAESGGKSTSRAIRRCGTAQPPTVEFIRSEDPCVNSIGGPCTWYDVAVAGFSSGVSPLVNVRRVNGLPWCEGCEYDRIEVGADGRGYLAHDWKISRDEGQVILDVGGVTGEFHVYY